MWIIIASLRRPRARLLQATVCKPDLQWTLTSTPTRTPLDPTPEAAVTAQEPMRCVGGDRLETRQRSRSGVGSRKRPQRAQTPWQIHAAPVCTAAETMHARRKCLTRRMRNAKLDCVQASQRSVKEPAYPYTPLFQIASTGSMTTSTAATSAGAATISRRRLSES